MGAGWRAGQTQHAVGDSLTVVLPGESDDDDWVFVVDTYALDVTFGSYAIFEAPTDDACIATHASPDEEEPPVVTHDGPFVETDPDAAVDALRAEFVPSIKKPEEVVEASTINLWTAAAHFFAAPTRFFQRPFGLGRVPGSV